MANAPRDAQARGVPQPAIARGKGGDGREVVWVGFVTAEEALAMNIVPHLREYLERRRAGEAKA